MTTGLSKTLDAGASPRAGVGKSRPATAWSRCGKLLALTLGGSQVHLLQNTVDGWGLSRVITLGTDKCTATSLEFGEGCRSKRRRQDRRSSAVHNYSVLCVGTTCGDIKIYDLSTGRIVWYLRDHKKAVQGVSCAHDGSLLLATASLDGTCKLWDLWDDGNMYKTLSLPGCSAWHKMVWSPNMRQLCGVGAQKSAILWSGDDRAPRKLLGHQNTVVDAAYSPDGALVATASLDTRVILWDTDSGEKLQQLWHGDEQLHFIYQGGSNDHHVRHVAVSAHGGRLLSLCDDGKVRIWRMEERATMQQVQKRVTHTEVELPSVTTAAHKNGMCLSGDRTCARFVVGPYEGKFLMYESSTNVPSLQHLCRLSIRNDLPSCRVSTLPVPRMCHDFLQYK